MFMVNIASVRVFCTRGHSYEEDRHLHAIEILLQISETIITPTAHREFGTDFINPELMPFRKRSTRRAITLWFKPITGKNEKDNL